MGSKEFAVRYLKAVEKKNEVYFTANRLNILDCVELIGSSVVSVRVINKQLPLDIVSQIESMFWP